MEKSALNLFAFVLILFLCNMLSYPSALARDNQTEANRQTAEARQIERDQGARSEPRAGFKKADYSQDENKSEADSRLTPEQARFMGMLAIMLAAGSQSGGLSP